MKKKGVVCLLMGLSMMIGALSGCGGNKEESSAETDSGSVVIWTNLENEAETLKEYAEKWEAETGNKVEVIHETADIQQFAQAVKSADGPDGIYGIANDQLANYIDAGLVQEVPEEVYKDEDYVAAAVQACYAEGKRYGVPVAVETNALFYNTDKIKELPATWEELLEVAKEQGGIQFEASSIYYDLGFLRAYDSYIFKYEDGNYDVEDIGLGKEEAIKA